MLGEDNDFGRNRRQMRRAKSKCLLEKSIVANAYLDGYMRRAKFAIYTHFETGRAEAHVITHTQKVRLRVERE
jgi:hypothetical protein